MRQDNNDRAPFLAVEQPEGQINQVEIDVLPPLAEFAATQAESQAIFSRARLAMSFGGVVTMITSFTQKSIQRAIDCSSFEANAISIGGGLAIAAVVFAVSMRSNFQHPLSTLRKVLCCC